MRSLISYTFSAIAIPYAIITSNWLLAALTTAALALNAATDILQRKAAE